MAEQKACGFYPGSLASSSLSLPFSLSLYFSSFFSSRFSPHFPLRPSFTRSPRLTAILSSLSPQRSSPRSFFSSRYASFYATAQLRSVPVSRPFPSLSDARDHPVSFSPFLSSASPALPNSTISVAFSPMLSPAPLPNPSSSTCKPIAHASERARGPEPYRERGSEKEREDPSAVHMSERKRAAGELAREKERRKGPGGGIYRQRAMGYAAGGKRKRKERSGGC